MKCARGTLLIHIFMLQCNGSRSSASHFVQSCFLTPTIGGATLQSGAMQCLAILERRQALVCVHLRALRARTQTCTQVHSLLATTLRAPLGPMLSSAM